MSQFRFNHLIKHVTKILIHKYYVAKYCFKCGMYYQGIMHDMSKFSLVELIESVKYYTGTSSPLVERIKDAGYSEAWLHHKGRNKHHSEYWTNYNHLGMELIPMPYEYAMELICDWIGASISYSNDKNFNPGKQFDWFRNRLNQPINMHEHTIKFVGYVFWLMAECNDADRILKNQNILRELYNNIDDYVPENFIEILKNRLITKVQI